MSGERADVTVYLDKSSTVVGVVGSVSEWELSQLAKIGGWKIPSSLPEDRPVSWAENGNRGGWVDAGGKNPPPVLQAADCLHSPGVPNVEALRTDSRKRHSGS